MLAGLSRGAGEGAWLLACLCWKLISAVVV
jgi:hypothetical protein